MCPTIRFMATTMADRGRFIVFDIDGTLLDSYAQIMAAIEFAFHAANLPSPAPEKVRNGIGLAVEDMINGIKPGLSAQKVDQIAQSYRGEFRASALRTSRGEASDLFDGAFDLLKVLAAQKTTLLGIASGKSRRGYDRMVAALGLEDMFHTQQLSDDHPSKPHPSMLLTAMAEAGVTPEQTVMVGDTSYDMQMAKSANVRGIGVKWGYHMPEVLRDAGAQCIASDFDELRTLLDA